MTPRQWPLPAVGLAAALAGACLAGQDQAVPQRAPASPVTLRLVADAKAPEPGSAVQVDWRVERASSFAGPLALTVRAPGGVEVAGDAEAPIPDAPGVTRGTVVLRLSGAVPRDDVAFILHGASETAGVHAEARYRFGRPEPVDAPPPRDAPSPRTGSIDPGPGVKMD